MSARFEIVRGINGQWFGRFIAANNREVWRTSETYRKRGGVEKAIGSVARSLDLTVDRGAVVTAAGRTLFIDVDTEPFDREQR